MKYVKLVLLLLFYSTVSQAQSSFGVNEMDTYIKKAGLTSCKEIYVVSNCDGIDPSNTVSCKTDRITVNKLKIQTLVDAVLFIDEDNSRAGDSICIPYNQIAFLTKRKGRLYVYIKSRD